MSIHSFFLGDDLTKRYVTPVFHHIYVTNFLKKFVFWGGALAYKALYFMGSVVFGRAPFYSTKFIRFFLHFRCTITALDPCIIKNNKRHSAFEKIEKVGIPYDRQRIRLYPQG